MAASKEGLRGLREQAEATLFDGWGVTPELKRKLQRRIAEAEEMELTGSHTGEHPLTEPRRASWRKRTTWRLWLGPVVAAACVALVVAGQLMPQLGGPTGTTEQAGQVAEGQAPAAQAPAGAPATVPPPVSQVPGYGQVVDQYGDRMTVTKVDIAPITVPNQSAASLTAQVLDKSSAFTVTNGVGTNVTLTDANGNTVPSESITIPGIEAKPGQMIVLNAEYQLQVKDANAAMRDLQNLATGAGGYVIDAALNKGSDGSWAGRLTLRIPAGAYTGAIDRVRQAGEVKHERQWSQDVTDQYTDLEARVRIQQEYETKLTELAAKAETFEDWLKLTQQINETRAQIERMQGTLKQLGNQVQYSTVNVTLTQPAPDQPPAPAPRPASGQGLWPQMRWAFGESVRTLGGFGRDFLVGLAGVAPFIVLLTALAVVVAVALRGRRRRRDQEMP
jgi:hypothetical protein